MLVGEISNWSYFDILEHNVFEEQAATEVSCILLHMMPAVQRFQWPKGLQSLMRVRKKNRCQVFKDAFSNPILHALHFLRFQCCTIGPHQFLWLVWSWGFCERFQLQQIFPSTKSKLQTSDEFLSANPPKKNKCTSNFSFNMPGWHI